MISIPNPCHEDFEKMSPTEKGAYCKVCSTDTYDFRNLSNGEIFQIMEENKGGHVCGRFTKDQLANLNMPAYFAWKNQTSKTFQSKFLLACLLVFGLGLFSCDDQGKETLKEIQIEQVLQETEEPRTAYINGNIDPEIMNIDLLDYTARPIICDYELQGDVVTTEHFYETAGVVAYREPVEDYQLGGAVVMTEYNILEPTIINEDTIKESTLSNPIVTDPTIFEAKAYPNPTQGLSTIALDVEHEGQFDINMYNMSGQLVTSVHSGHLYEGRQTFELDMYNYNSGMYIVKIISQGQNETLKIQKVN